MKINLLLVCPTDEVCQKKVRKMSRKKETRTRKHK